jgi:hypothetical protein
VSNAASGSDATVSGGLQDTASAQQSVVSGGFRNVASGTVSVVAGGEGNTASGIYATVSGGRSNVVAGHRSVVSGGQNNRARADYSVIAGGGSATAADSNFIAAGADHGTVSGGGGNHITGGSYATIPGGFANSAGGSFAFAGGRGASASNFGSFVWGSSSLSGATSSFADYSVTFRCQNGARFYTGAVGTLTGVSLAAGGGSWASLSDSAQKENRNDVNSSEVLDKLNQLKISEWNYKSQDDNIRHMGPMAQDFSAAFGLGENNTTITTVDADGVMMAAIQELAKRVDDLTIQNQKLQAQVQSLTAAKQESAR